MSDNTNLHTQPDKRLTEPVIHIAEIIWNATQINEQLKKAGSCRRGFNTSCNIDSIGPGGALLTPAAVSLSLQWKIQLHKQLDTS